MFLIEGEVFLLEKKNNKIKNRVIIFSNLKAKKKFLLILNETLLINNYKLVVV